jgi:hypothetical protein
MQASHAPGVLQLQKFSGHSRFVNDNEISPAISGTRAATGPVHGHPIHIHLQHSFNSQRGHAVSALNGSQEDRQVLGLLS